MRMVLIDLVLFGDHFQATPLMFHGDLLFEERIDSVVTSSPLLLSAKVSLQLTFDKSRGLDSGVTDLA